MSQIETVMLIGLGFAVATLLALLAGRAAWAIALRLGTKRAQRTAPAEFIELQTERDRLRAEHAMMARKLELRLDDLKSRMVEQMAEVTRGRNRIQTMGAELGERESEAAALRERVQVLERENAERVAALEASREDIAQRGEEARMLRHELTAAREALAAREGELAAKAAEPPPRPKDAAAEEVEMHVARSHLKRRIAELNDLARQIEGQRTWLQSERHALTGALAGVARDEGAGLFESGRALEEKIAEAERDADAISEELTRLDEAWTGKLRATGATGERPREAEPRPNAAAPESEPARRRAAGGVANVISLAQRIRALKSDLTG